MRTMMMLVRREFWEHRMLLFAPIAMCVIFLVLCVLAGANFNIGWMNFDGTSGVRQPMPPGFYLVMNLGFTILLYMLMAMVAFFYLCDCLYAERKDRSILFWKSLPVSDTMTVLSKLVVALIGVPLVVYGLALVTNALSWVIFMATLDFAPSRGPTALNWLKMNGYLLADVFVLALWFAPIAAYQLVVSVWVPRAVAVWTLLPPVAVILGQKIFFDSWSIAELVRQRLGGFTMNLGGSGGESAAAAIGAINAIPLLARADLWIGVAIAAVLVFLTIRIRRHSDDT